MTRRRRRLVVLYYECDMDRNM